jgi:hypothetical protein
VYGVTGDLATGLSVLTNEYTGPAIVHAIAYESAGGLKTAMAYGRAEVIVGGGRTRLVTMELLPIERFGKPQFEVKAPPGFAAAAVDIYLGFSTTSGALYASVPLGQTMTLPLVPGAGYTYRVVATSAAGAVSDTGESGFDLLREDPIEIELPDVPSVLFPVDGETRGVGDSLLVDGEGVFEHVLTPTEGKTTLRIVTAQRETTLPDLAVLGAAPAIGSYTWTVRTFPMARFADDLSGTLARRFRPMGASAPRTLVLR